MMQAVQISEKVYWVGAIDWNIRDFHGYSTKRGTTYNAYLIMSEKPTLIDTVKKEFYDEMMERIQSVIDPKKIQIIISNHSEMDHSGALPQAVEAIEPEEVYVSSMGFKDITAQFHRDLKLKTVKTGDRIDVGGDTVSFVEARMLHWPDSMFSYLEKENVLFTNDVFGMHYATGKLFDDENEERLWLYEAEKYYANIVLPYSDIVLRFLAQVQKMGLSPKMIAPDHGFIWRKDPSKIINLYAKWASQAPNNKAVIVYDTMWGSTEKMASYISDGLREGGTVVVSGYNNFVMSFDADIEKIFAKQITIKGVNNGIDEITSAINFLANHVVRTEILVGEVYDFEDAPKAFEDCQHRIKSYGKVLIKTKNM